MRGIVLACALGALVRAAAGEVVDPERLAGREAQLAVPALVAERERLAAEVAALQEQVRQLTLGLAEAVAELDAARVQAERATAAAAGGTPETVQVAEARVVDVNERLRMVVLDAGRRQGVRPGLTFAVLRDRRTVATVRVVESRERIAGAVIESAERTPQPGDRAVLTR